MGHNHLGIKRPIHVQILCLIAAEVFSLKWCDRTHIAGHTVVLNYPAEPRVSFKNHEKCKKAFEYECRADAELAYSMTAQPDLREFSTSCARLLWSPET